MAERKKTNNDLQNITQKNKDRATRFSIKNMGELRYPGRVRSYCSTGDTRDCQICTYIHNHFRRNSATTPETEIWKELGFVVRVRVFNTDKAVFRFPC